MTTNPSQPNRPRLPMLALCLSLTALPVTGDADDPGRDRFRIEGRLQAVTLSADGRFRLDAQARFDPTTASPDGRYALKAVHIPEGGCEAQPENLFANGFE